MRYELIKQNQKRPKILKTLSQEEAQAQHTQGLVWPENTTSFLKCFQLPIA